MFAAPFDRSRAGQLKSPSIFATREKFLSSPLPETKLSRKERELQFRINLVLDAAEDVFAESSYADASVEVIAHRAEISIGTLYNLFHSKEDIYRAVVSRAQENFFAQIMTKIAVARGPRDQVRALVAYFFEHFSHYSRQFRHYVAASNGFQWELKSQLDHEALNEQGKFLKRVVEICERGMESGVFKKSGLSAELMAVTLLGIPHSFLMIWLDKQGIDLMSLVPQALVAADRVTGAEVG
jgi:AcrR family transcriptional regulator